MMLDTNLDFAKETNLARLLESRCRMLSNVIWNIPNIFFYIA